VFEFDDNGSYVVSLTATDDDGGVSDTATATIDVTNVAPAAAINDAPTTSPEGTPISLSSSVTDAGAVVVDAKGVETTLPADTVIAAAPRKSNQTLFADFEWMVDELHGCGDALMPRGMDAAIHEGYRLGARI